jgi:Ca2+-binding RTX toxin-like protein
MGSWNGKAVTMTGTPEGDLLDGGTGNDWLQGTGEIDQLIGGAGNDLLSGFNGDDIIRGDAGNDVLAGGSHADVLSGGDGDDILVGEGYFTTSVALTLDNLAQFVVSFTASAAGYYTGYVSSNFTIKKDAPNGGDDILSGGAGRDMLFGGVGNDTLDGGTESDSLFGGEGDDVPTCNKMVPYPCLNRIRLTIALCSATTKNQHNIGIGMESSADDWHWRLAA